MGPSACHAFTRPGAGTTLRCLQALWVAGRWRVGCGGGCSSGLPPGVGDILVI